MGLRDGEDIREGFAGEIKATFLSSLEPFILITVPVGVNAER